MAMVETSGVPLGARDLIERYAERINTHDFDEVAPLIAEDAVFWFSDGSHVGQAAIRSAFEATWRVLAEETYWLDDLRWLAWGTDAATCIYTFHWRAVIDGVAQSGFGRGTSVLARKSAGWQIVHEHLSLSR
jgi:ketosteroid isomerase-like protein